MREITIDGVTYPSVIAASRALGVNRSKIRRCLDLKPVSLVGPLTIRGTEYPSVTAAARELNVSAKTIYEARHAGRLDNVGLSKEKSHAA